MKAIILAAGFGMRLRPLTAITPKVLINIGGIPLLIRILNNLKQGGVTEVYINTHHLVNRIETFLREHQFGIPIKSIYEPDILDTAGAVVNAYSYLRDSGPVIIYNGDSLTDFDLNSLIRSQQTEQNFVTLTVKKNVTDRPFLIDETMQIVGHRNLKNGVERIAAKPKGAVQEYGFCGIHVISQEALQLLVSKDRKGVSLTDFYLELIQTKNARVRAFDIGDAPWFDIGTPEKLKEARAWVGTQSERVKTDHFEVSLAA